MNKPELRSLALISATCLGAALGTGTSIVLLRGLNTISKELASTADPMILAFTIVGGVAGLLDWATFPVNQVINE